jgi:hypothetical protein
MDDTGCPVKVGRFDLSEKVGLYQKQKAGLNNPASLFDSWIQTHLSRFLILNAPNPAMPARRRSMVVGSGMGVGTKLPMIVVSSTPSCPAGVG